MFRFWRKKRGVGSVAQKPVSMEAWAVKRLRKDVNDLNDMVRALADLHGKRFSFGRRFVLEDKRTSSQKEEMSADTAE